MAQRGEPETITIGRATTGDSFPASSSAFTSNVVEPAGSWPKKPPSGASPAL